VWAQVTAPALSLGAQPCASCGGAPAEQGTIIYVLVVNPAAMIIFQQTPIRILVLFMLLLCSQAAHAQWSVDVEGNYVLSIPYNSVRIPSDGGTRFDLAKDLDAETTYTFRARVSYSIRDRHVISALAAPLTIRSAGETDRDIRYDDHVFSAHTHIRATYKFNSYRLTYRYLFVYKDNLKIGAGITAKVREANITLRSEDGSADFPDLGVVPLVNFYLHWLPAERVGLLLEGDALGTAQGRAEDIFAGVTVKASAAVQVKAGYRMLEGGANVTDNYNFTFVNYAAVGAVVNF
jgi:hypothetical protein